MILILNYAPIKFFKTQSPETELDQLRKQLKSQTLAESKPKKAVEAQEAVFNDIRAELANIFSLTVEPAKNSTGAQRKLVNNLAQQKAECSVDVVAHRREKIERTCKNLRTQIATIDKKLADLAAKRR